MNKNRIMMKDKTKFDPGRENNTEEKFQKLCDKHQVSCISDPYRETQGFGSEITYVSDGVPRSTHPLSSDRDFAKLLKPDRGAQPRRTCANDDDIIVHRLACHLGHGVHPLVSGPGITLKIISTITGQPGIFRLARRCIPGFP